MLGRREIIFDTETTGMDADHVKNPDKIVEIGCVEVVNFIRTGREFHCYINPERDVPEEVVRIHGLTGAFLSKYPPFRDPSIVDAFLAFVGDADIVAHNASFDMRFINAELTRLGRPGIAESRFIDTRKLAKERLRPGTRLSLDALAAFFKLDERGFDLSGRKGAAQADDVFADPTTRKGHGALIDSRMLAEVYLELNGGREQRLSFLDGPETGQGGSEGPAGLVRRAPRPVALPPRLTQDERAAHAAFVATLGKDALWLKPDDPSV